MVSAGAYNFSQCVPNEICQVAVERVAEYIELVREPAEFVEPRPPASWPENGAIKCENLVIRYAVSSPI
jgi:hypothetical protein